MKRKLLSLLGYAVSLAVLVFQFIIPGYSDLLFYGYVALHAALWVAIYRLSCSAAHSRTLSIVLSAIAAIVFSLAPFDVIIPSLFSPEGSQGWLTVILRLAIHAVCLAVMILTISKRENPA